jgi:hypothetical protein
MKGETPDWVLVCAMLLSAAVSAMECDSAAGSERVGDASAVYALRRHADVEILLEREIGAAIDAATDDDRFDLYRAFNQLSGTWSQIELLDKLLLASIAAAPSEEDDLRTTLRDQAQFVLWEIDDAEERLAQDSTQPARLRPSQTSGSIRAFLAEVRRTVERLQAEEQARPFIQ